MKYPESCQRHSTIGADGYFWAQNAWHGICRDCYLKERSRWRTDWKMYTIIWYDSLEHLVNLQKENE